MVSYVDALRNAIRNGFCSILQNNAAFFDFWDRFDPVYPGVESGFNRNLYRSICNREPPQGTPESPVVGGQCELVQYSVQATTQLQDKETQVVRTVNREYTCAFPNNVYGPVGNPQLDVSNPAASFVFFTHRNAQNNPVSANLAQFDSTQEDWIGTNMVANRCDGQPDNCGNSQPVPPPVGYNVYNTNITYIDENNTEITIPVSIEFNDPIVDIDANVRIPIDINITDPVLNIEGKFDADFNVSDNTINFNFGNNSGGDGRPKDCVPTPDDGGDTPAPPPDSNAPDQPPPPDPETERIIIGAIVTSTAVSPSASAIFQSDGQPTIYVPAMGYIHFRVRVGRAATAWLTEIPVKNTRHFIPCPWEAGALEVRYTPRPGTLSSVTPIYRNNAAGTSTP